MSKNAALPYNDAPFTQVLYVDPATGRRTRSRIDSDLSSVRFELAAPIRTFPAYRGRRSHSGRYFFSRSGSHVGYESRFERTALSYVDFCGEASAASSNPFFFLWPKGSRPVRHVPDFYFVRRTQRPLLLDVKPESRMTDVDRVQHRMSREACAELGWDYQEFTSIDRRAEFNLRLLSGYSHRRFRPSAALRDVILAVLAGDHRAHMSISELASLTLASTSSSDAEVVSGIYHLIWSGDLHFCLEDQLNWAAKVLR